MRFTPEVIESLCEHVDGQRANGRTYGTIWEELVRAGRGTLDSLTQAQLEDWHRTWQRRQAQAMQRQPYVVGDVPEAGDARIGEGSVEESPSRSEDMASLLWHLGQDLVEMRPSWQYAKTRTLRAGERVLRRRGAGELAGVAWQRCAVVIYTGEETASPAAHLVVEVLPEHRVRCIIPARPPVHYASALRLEEYTVGGARAAEALLEIDVRLKETGLGAEARKRLEAKRARIMTSLAAAGGKEGVSVLKIRSVVSRLATAMRLYLPADHTGVSSAAAMARAKGQTRAAESYTQLQLVERDTAATGGRAGFAGVRAAGRHREKVRRAEGIRPA